MLRIVSLCLIAMLGGGPAPASTAADPPPRNGEALIRQMHDRYEGKWYRTLTFIQKTTLPNGTVETWYEALTAPGLLRIDVAPLDSMNTLIFRNDSIYDFRGGNLDRSAPVVHPLLVLGFDVYLQPVAETLRKLRGLKFDLSKLHETTWQGRPTYVVGAAAGDSTSPQFWIDKERLYFVRSLEPSQKNPATMLDTRFEKYRRMGDGWLELEVVFLAGGEVKMREEYIEPRIGMELDAALYDTRKWTPPTWIGRAAASGAD
ncbi:MAG: hypothetical protein H0T68_08725 [Gemmatimonadales bacterium]|nr:hypothetical protein [Gemmatimonadales bacterium]